MTRECTSNFPHQEVKRGGRCNHNIETPLRTTASRERCTTQSFPATSSTNALTIPHPKAPAVEHISFFFFFFFCCGGVFSIATCILVEEETEKKMSDYTDDDEEMMDIPPSLRPYTTCALEQTACHEEQPPCR